MPHIAITSSFREWPSDTGAQQRLSHYVHALGDAGVKGELIWLPVGTECHGEMSERLLSQFDGLVMAGGYDLPPSLYGETAAEGANMQFVPEERPALEKVLVEGFLASGKPVLGICYGCQFLNVWGGGTLVQDIPSQWNQPITHHEGAHAVRLGEGTKLAGIVESGEFAAPSFHHQAVARPAPTSRVAAMAPDGVIEAIEYPDHDFCIGVQWHPERDRGSAATSRLFQAFAASCAR